MAELVYAPVLGTGTRKGLGVRVSPAAHEFLILGDENGKGSGNGSFPLEERIENRGSPVGEFKERGARVRCPLLGTS